MAKSISAVVIAAGLGSLGGRSKALLPLDGTPLVRGVVDTISAAGIAEICVVTDPGASEVEGALSGSSARVVPAAAATTAAGVQAGVDAAGASDAVLFIPANMPLVSAELVTEAITRFNESADGIFTTVYQSVPGYPRIVERRFRDALAATVEEGADPLALLLMDHPRDVLDLHVLTDAVLFDVRDDEDYAEIHQRRGLVAPEPAS